ncbi:hypothetical protein PENTCL1PPCAC_13000, partial [Pristionchus entomophagus]
FTWTDGSNWDYDNTYPDYPKNGEGDCLAMDTFSSTGQWMNTDCFSKLPYACVRPDPIPVCTDGPWQPGTNVRISLKICILTFKKHQITSPGYPYDASTACDYVLSVPSGRVQVTIYELQANSNCDYLMLSDQKLGGNLVANLTGQLNTHYRITYTSQSNFMRVSWQPRGGVNVKGFKVS